MRDYEYKTLNINDLYVNPENYRYINDAKDEIDAIISMFNVNTGTPIREMLNLSKDIIEDGLNPFEMPIVCFDEDLGKYIVYEGNRRITCIKLMTQYKNNDNIKAQIPSVSEIYKLNCSIEEVQCVIFFNPDDAKHFLYKIHQDINDGIGRKQWDSQAKKKAEAANGNISKTYSIVEFLKQNPLTDKSLIKEMDTNRWISKLERVVGFTRFREVYNITFDEKNGLIYLDTQEQVVIMMSKLIKDIIHNSATGNFRFKTEFDNYTAKLENRYKTQVSNNEDSNKSNNNQIPSQDKNKKEEKQNQKRSDEKDQENHQNNNSNASNHSATGTPRDIHRRSMSRKEALILGKNYPETAYSCLNEKGKQMLLELEALDVNAYPFASAALCRALLECVTKLWIDSETHTTFNSKSLAGTYSGCINNLLNKGIIDRNEHKVLSAEINKQNFITLLNTWIHSDTSACVSKTNLVSGWTNTRILIEKYIDRNMK